MAFDPNEVICPWCGLRVEGAVNVRYVDVAPFFSSETCLQTWHYECRVEFHLERSKGRLRRAMAAVLHFFGNLALVAVAALLWAAVILRVIELCG
jgi:hypothetical protein